MSKFAPLNDTAMYRAQGDALVKHANNAKSEEEKAQLLRVAAYWFDEADKAAMTTSGMAHNQSDAS